MEVIKENFEHDFNLAVKSFNEKDYISFFRNVRPAIEWIGKLLIYDILGENDAEELIEGNTSIEFDRSMKTYRIINYPPNHKPTGREFCELVPHAYYTKHTDITTSRLDETKKRLKRGMDSCASAFSRYYSISSELGNHTGNTSLNKEVQAISCAAFFTGYFDFLKCNKVSSASTISYFEQLDQFRYESQDAMSDAKQQISDLIDENEKKEAALMIAQKMQAEAEKSRIESEQKTESFKKEIEELNNTIADLQEKLSAQTHIITEDHKEDVTQENDMRHLKDVLLSGGKGIHIDQDALDEDQLDLIEYEEDRSMLVSGCAGSGKSVIAMYKAEQLYSHGKDIILIAYTKSLNQFMKVDIPGASYKFFYYHEWKRLKMPKADYLIVDEIQDFGEEEIKEFINATKKCFFFFGDTAQSIYRQYGETMSLSQISQMTGLKILNLYNNYRLPRPIAKITEDYVGVDVPEYKEKNYLNLEKELPHFVQVNPEKEITTINTILSSNYGKSIGILCNSNPMVLQINKQLQEYGVECEFKYNDSMNEKNNVSTLNFNSLVPKILTYHSAKGLQFDVVIIPEYSGALSNDSRKALYVAMTRTMHKLYVLYSTPELLAPLKNVKPHLYLKTL